jgi:hypothetical protein
VIDGSSNLRDDAVKEGVDGEQGEGARVLPGGEVGESW